MTLIIDSSNIVTELCLSGGLYNTDKSPLSYNGPFYNHRKGYTAVYNLIFSTLKDKPINFCEIGLLYGSGLRMFNDYFSDAKFYGIDNNVENINTTSQHVPGLYTKANVNSADELHRAFEEFNVKFDIVVDDSTHDPEHHEILLDVVPQYLNSGGIFVIEDLNDDCDESIYQQRDFKTSMFISCEHKNTYDWNNHKIWYGVK